MAVDGQIPVQRDTEAVASHAFFFRVDVIQSGLHIRQDQASGGRDTIFFVQGLVIQEQRNHGARVRVDPQFIGDPLQFHVQILIPVQVADHFPGVIALAGDFQRILAGDDVVELDLPVRIGVLRLDFLSILLQDDFRGSGRSHSEGRHDPFLRNLHFLISNQHKAFFIRFPTLQFDMDIHHFFRQQIGELRDPVGGSLHGLFPVFLSGNPDLGTGLRLDDEFFQVGGHPHIKVLVTVQFDDFGNRMIVLPLDPDFVPAGFQIRHFELAILAGRIDLLAAAGENELNIRIRDRPDPQFIPFHRLRHGIDRHAGRRDRPDVRLCGRILLPAPEKKERTEDEDARKQNRRRSPAISALKPPGALGAGIEIRGVLAISRYRLFDQLGRFVGGMPGEGPLHRFKQLGRALEAVFGFLRQHLHDDRRRRRGNTGIDLPGIGDRSGKQFVEDFDRIAAGIRQPSRQHFIERGAEAVNVRPRIDSFRIPCLFRRKICRRAHHHIGLGHPGVRVLLRDPQIGEFDHPLFREHDVVRLDVAVDDLLFLGGLQSGRNGFDDNDRLFLRQGMGLAGFQNVLQAAPVDILHDDIRPDDGIRLDVHDADHVWMTDLRGELRLADKTVQKFLVGLQKLFGQDFDHAVSQRLVHSQVDFAHPALSDHFFDGILPDGAFFQNDALRPRHDRRRRPGRFGLDRIDRIDRIGRPVRSAPGGRRLRDGNGLHRHKRIIGLRADGRGRLVSGGRRLRDGNGLHRHKRIIGLRADGRGRLVSGGRGCLHHGHGSRENIALGNG